MGDAATASKIAVLANPGNPIHRLIVAEELPQIARNLGVALPIVEGRRRNWTSPLPRPQPSTPMQ